MANKSTQPTQSVQAPQQVKQEMKTSNLIAILAAISVLVLLIGGLAVKSLGKDFLLNQKVISKKNTAQRTLASDVVAAKNISQQYSQLGGNGLVISDALPSDSDIPGLANAISNMASISDTQFNSVAGGSGDSSGGVTTSAPSASTSLSSSNGGTNAATAVPISISVNTSYNELPTFLGALESSARPIIVNSLELSGTNADLAVSISATTYLQTPVTFTVGKETVK